jgi:hypothetical protein
MRTKERLRARIFNSYAFSGTEGADNLPLCDNSHPHERTEEGTWDNLGTGDLTVDTAHALRLLGQNMTDDAGEPYPVDITEWLIPTALERKMEEIKVAPKDPETSLNTPNVLIKGQTYTVSPHLSDTDAYFAFGNLEGEEKGIYEVVLIADETINNSPSDGRIVLDRTVKMFVAYGFARSKNVYGSAGA